MTPLSVSFVVASALSSLFFPIASPVEAATETVLHSFCSQKDCADGSVPTSALISMNGTLYGVTSGGGSYMSGIAFALDPSTGAETVLHSFGSGVDGALPQAELMDMKGLLYGTTAYGGTGNGGTVFSIEPTTGLESVVYSFCTQNNCADGAQPIGGVTKVKGTLYGTTEHGGANCQGVGCGTAYSLGPNTGSETVIYSFCNENDCPDGSYPVATLINVTGTLYGTTNGGGASSDGTVFSLDRETGAESVVFSFDFSDGGDPSAGLINVNGTFYGTTPQGGPYSGGTVFALDPSTGVETVLYYFGKKRTDGRYPSGGLIELNGVLYGTTFYGGANCRRAAGCGTVFSIDPNTGAETMVYSFCSQRKCLDGSSPDAGLLNVSGTLYGTTYKGGTKGAGTVFSITP